MTASGTTINSQKSQDESSYWCDWFCMANPYPTAVKIKHSFPILTHSVPSLFTV